MDQSKVLLKSTLVYTIGNIGSKIIIFCLLPVFTFYLSKSDLGKYDLMITTISLVVPFASLQISDAVYRWLVEANGDDLKKKQAITNGLVVITLSIGAFIAIFSLVNLFVYFDFPLYFLLILVVSSYLPFFQQVIRGMGKGRLYSVVGIVNALLIACVNGLFILFIKNGVSGLFSALIIANFISICFIFYSLGIGKYVSLEAVNISVAKKMLAYSWPLIPNMISWWLISTIDRYIILYFMNTDANGIYAVSTRFPAIITVINSVFLLAWQDHAVANSSQKKFVSDTFRRYMILEFSLIFVLIASSKIMVGYLVDSRFTESWRYMPFLYLGVGFASFASYVGVGYLKEKKTKGVFFTTLIGAIVNIIISSVLINYIGLLAPGIGVFISFLLVFFIRVHQSKEFFPIEIDKPLFLKLMSIAFLVIGLTYVDNVLFNWVNMTVCVVMLVYLNLDILKKVVSKGMTKSLQ